MTPKCVSVCVCDSRCEQSLLLSTSVLCACIRLVRSSYFLDQFIHFLVRTPPTCQLLLQHCDHISDQVTATIFSYNTTSAHQVATVVPAVAPVLQVDARWMLKLQYRCWTPGDSFASVPD